MIPRYPFSMSEEELQKRYSAIPEALNKRIALKIQYRSNDNVVRERVIHPYKLYMYNNAWFTLAYCEMAKDMRYFKLNRITAFELTAKNFDYIYSYREGSEWNEWLDGNSMKKVPDWSGDIGGADASMRVKLHLSGRPAMYVKEYLYGAEQIITEIDKNTTILEFTAQYKYNLLQLVLGFDTDCEVLEPEWLREEMFAQITKITEKYKNQKITKKITRSVIFGIKKARVYQGIPLPTVKQHAEASFGVGSAYAEALQTSASSSRRI